MAQFISNNNEAVRITDICNFWIEGEIVFLATSIRVLPVDFKTPYPSIQLVSEIIKYAENYKNSSTISISWEHAFGDVREERRLIIEKESKMLTSKKLDS